MNFKILVTFVFVNAFALQSFCQHSSDVMDNDDNDSLPQDDVSVRDEGARRKLGPFNMSLESGATRLFLTWSVFIEDDLDDRMNEIEFSLFTNSKKINWVAFGFAKGNDFRKADWFVAWKSIRKGRIYSKDCNSMSGILHFDRHQDYDVLKLKRHPSFNLTVRRALDTGDTFDVPLEKNKDTTLVWAYGMATQFSKIKHEIKKSWKSKTINLLKREVKHPGNKSEEGKNGKEEEKSSKEEDNSANESNGKEKTKQMKENITIAPKMSHKDEEKLITHQDFTKASEEGPKKTSNDHIENMTTEHSLEESSKPNTTKPCTVIIKYSRSWQDYIKLKDQSVYYAILGSAAIMTGIIVIILACCCRVTTTTDGRRSKVSFYKVDDFEDEQVEFLKEKA